MSTVSRDVLIRRALARREQHRRRAQTDPAALAEYILRTKSGAPVRNARHHVEWHRFLDEHPWAVLISPIEHGKTLNVAVTRILFELGSNPNAIILLIGNSEDAAADTLKLVRQMIDESPELREVFPHLRRSTRKGDPWTSTEITVQREARGQRDPSIRAWGAHAKLQGARADLIVFDDVLNHESTSSETQRKKLLDWFDAILATRLVEGGRMVMIGTPWHPQDILHTVAKRPDWAEARYGAVLNPDDAPERWVPLWPEQWSRERLQQRQRNTTDYNFQRKYLCRVVLDSTARFKQAWIKAAGVLGRGMTFLPEAPVLDRITGERMPCFVGLDLGPGSKRKKQDSAVSAMVVLGLQPGGRRRVLDVSAGKWTMPEILDRLHDINRRYTPTVISIESNATQVYVTQMAEAQGLPVRAYYTGSQKWDPAIGVESLAVKMRDLRYILPTTHDGEWADPELEALVSGMTHYSPDSHTSDYLMALWFAERAVVDWSGEMTARGQSARN